MAVNSIPAWNKTCSVSVRAASHKMAAKDVDGHSRSGCMFRHTAPPSSPLPARSEPSSSGLFWGGLITAVVSVVAASPSPSTLFFFPLWPLLLVRPPVCFLALLFQGNLLLKYSNHRFCFQTPCVLKSAVWLLKPALVCWKWNVLWLVNKMGRDSGFFLSGKDTFLDSFFSCTTVGVKKSIVPFYLLSFIFSLICFF